MWQLFTAAATLEASVLLSLLLINVPALDKEHEFVPSVPAVTLPHEKLSAVVPVVSKVMELPLAAAVTVVVFVLELAVAPTAGKEVWQLLIAVARLAASVVATELVAKVPVVALEQPEVPAEIVPLPDKARLLVDVVKVKLLPVAFVTVTTLELTVAETFAVDPADVPKHMLLVV